jgi:threonine aldolase
VALAGRDRLVEDHALARRLGDEIAGRYPGSLDPALVETNMVRLDFSALGIDWPEMEDQLDGAGIKVNPPIGGSWRIVTHRDVDSTDVERLVGALP